MIEIESYLKHKNSFVPVSSFRGRIRDPRYIEGVIHLRVNGTDLVDMRMSDYVDCLWEYFVHMIEEVDASGAAETYFPDQPINVRIRHTRAHDEAIIEVRCFGIQRQTVKYPELRRVLLTNAQLFFESMCKLVPANRASYERVAEKIKELLAS